MDKTIIESIEKGWGDDSTFYTTRKNTGVVLPSLVVDEIREKEVKINDNFLMTTYCGYRDDKIVFSIPACSDVVLRYK